jgi:DNA-binding NarL/FixJ family response regulator
MAIALEPPPASPECGTVLSIDLARRRRLRRPATFTAIGVMVVGSHSLTRAGLRRLLDDAAGLTVVGEAGSAREAARLLRFMSPDVVLLDASGELELAGSMRLLGARVPVLLLAEPQGDDELLSALRAGATGVLPRDSRPAELASAIRMLAGGGALLPPRTVRRLIEELVNSTSIPR